MIPKKCQKSRAMSQASMIHKKKNQKSRTMSLNLCFHAPQS